MYRVNSTPAIKLGGSRLDPGFTYPAGERLDSGFRDPTEEKNQLECTSPTDAIYMSKARMTRMTRMARLDALI